MLNLQDVKQFSFVLEHPGLEAIFEYIQCKSVFLHKSADVFVHFASGYPYIPRFQGI